MCDAVSFCLVRLDELDRVQRQHLEQHQCLVDSLRQDLMRLQCAKQQLVTSPPEDVPGNAKCDISGAQDAVVAPAELTGSTDLSELAPGKMVALDMELEVGNLDLVEQSDSLTMCGDLSIRSEPPRSAFVVNVTRLVEVSERLDLLHEVVKCTAIASLTLVSAASRQELLNTFWFLLFVFILFADHMNRHDRLNVDDIKSVLQLIPSQPRSNCNRFLKAMTVDLGGRGRQLIRAVVQALVFFYILFAWVAVVWRLDTDDGHSVQAAGTELYEYFDATLFGDGQASEALGMQVTVLTFMYFLVILFRFIVKYETSCVMPTTTDGGVWDVQKLGVPLRFKLFGLPSMWFTNHDAKFRLQRWIEGLTPDLHVARIFPEEIACVAMTADHAERAEIATALRRAKFYDARRCWESPEVLGLELCFFVTGIRRESAEFDGEYIDVESSAPVVRCSRSRAASLESTQSSFRRSDALRKLAQ